MTWMRKAYAENPKHENAIVLASRLVDHEECYAEAEALFAGLLEKDETDVFALCWQGFLLRDKGQLYQSKESFERTLRVDDSYGHAHLGMGMILEETKD